MGKLTLLIVLSAILAFGKTQGNLYQTQGRFADLFVSHYERTAARMAAHSLANMALSTLRDSTQWRAGFSERPFIGATGGAMLADHTTDVALAAGYVRITSWGHSSGVSDTVAVLTRVPFVPPAMRGGATSNGPVNTGGGVIIDGRDHDLNGVVIPGQGVMGISTTQTNNTGGTSQIGGTVLGIDFAPSAPPNPAIIEQLGLYDFPETPDAVFEFPSGTLKAMAQSGVNGGQYATDPAALTLPLSGVTYLELPDGGTWSGMDFGDSSGLLVVHNVSGNAKLRNINAGTFTGLIIADEFDKLHATILGGVIVLSATPASPTIGNGSGHLRYSSEALRMSSSMAAGAGGGEVIVVSWWE